MKKLLISTALFIALSTAPATANPLIVIPAYIIGIFKFSQLANVATQGQDGLTLTEQSYQDCKKGSSRACLHKNIYTGMFLLPDVPLTVVAGCGAHLLESHGAKWHCIETSLPQITKVQMTYGGAHYNQFITKRR